MAVKTQDFHVAADHNALAIKIRSLLINVQRTVAQQKKDNFKHFAKLIFFKDSWLEGCNNSGPVSMSIHSSVVDIEERSLVWSLACALRSPSHL